MVFGHRSTTTVLDESEERASFLSNAIVYRPAGMEGLRVVLNELSL